MGESSSERCGCAAASSDAGGATQALSAAQRRLVAENIGLVTVHLRRFADNPALPRRDREWEDLFQEGCLGLIRAASIYRAGRGIPFAAFAMPRIRNAVGRALDMRFSTITVPSPAQVAQRKRRSKNFNSAAYKAPKVHSLSHRLARVLADGERGKVDLDRRPPSRRGARETVANRLRGKYERALDAACAAVLQSASRRDDRQRLVRMLKEGRFLVPHVELRRALRDIARETGSSYARVAQCDGRIAALVREMLAADPEFAALRRIAEWGVAGPERTIDARMERELAQVCADAFVRRLRSEDPPERARLLDEWLALSKVDMAALGRVSMARLSVRDRERLLRQCPVGGSIADAPDARDAMLSRLGRERSGRA